MPGPLHIAELENEFTKTEVKEFTLKMKNNKATSYDGIPASFGIYFASGGMELKP
jgi:hypothetical protein